jgi:hypothetical protein
MALRIARHDTSDIVELSDGTAWRLFPADVPVTLHWSSSTEFEVSPVAGEMWSHILLSLGDNARVRAIAATANWPGEALRRKLKEG